MLYLFSHRLTQSLQNFLVFIHLKLLAKPLASVYDFAANIVMLINITNKTYNIHDSIDAASTYDFVNIAMVINM